jgi:trehalose 6-phosphate synthase/phosphatase
MRSVLTNFKRIIIVSYRLPFRIETVGGQNVLKQNSGGLVSAISALSEKFGNFDEIVVREKIIWIGHGEHSEDEYNQASGADCKFKLLPVSIDDETNKLFYSGFSNDFLWPLFHYFTNYAVFNEAYFDAYVKAQRLFADKISEVATDDDLIWIHDYQLLMLPGKVREKMPEATIGFFLHTPFPSFETFRMMNRSWRESLLNGMLGADVVGFHINDYAQYFLRAVSRTLGYETGTNNVMADGRIIRVDAFPIGIDFKKFDEAARSKKVEKEVKQIKTSLGNRRLLFSVDRLDYTKGFLHRLTGYEYFLEKYPEWREKVVFNMIVIPSRDTIGSYQEMKKEIDALVGRINGKYGTIAWRPIIYQYRSVSFDELVALYNLCDVAVITPLRDGMNLVCKEFAACQTKNSGVLILSEMAGAAAELAEAVLINPTDKTEVASAINKALLLPAKERDLRIQLIRKRLMDYDVFSWAKDYINSVASIKKEQDVRKVVILDKDIKNTIVTSYNSSARRIIFLDYDGTLVPYSRIPELAYPSENTLKLIEKLSSDTKNQVVIISGRTRSFLDEYFSKLSVYLVAEHGAFVKFPSHKWQSEFDTDQSWKISILPILDRYTNHCVGSFIEEKTTSLVWHYRNLEASLAYLKVNQLREELRIVISNDTRLCMMEGNKVVEIRLSGYDKGFAAMKFLKETHFDFLLAIGDDKTDEDLFRVLPPDAFTLKVGVVPSLAKYNLKNQSDVSTLLSEFVMETSKNKPEITFINKLVNAVVN